VGSSAFPLPASLFSLSRSGPGYFRPNFDPIRTVRRFRPFLRLRFSVFRPPFFFIRARKPCLFFRFRLRGLYVGFMGDHP